MARLVVPTNLGGRQSQRFLDTLRDEPQVTIEAGKGVGSLRHVPNPTGERDPAS